MIDALKRRLPILKSLESYSREEMRGDLAGGLTTAVMLIPQGMAYAMLAGLPPIIGLYASTVPLIVYAMFGTSRQLAVGPVAIVSLMVAASVGKIAESGSDSYVAYAVTLAAMVGFVQLTMGVARLGFLVNLLSHPVVSGFTSAAALMIGFSQLKHLLGVDIPRSHHVHEIVLNAANRAGEIQPLTLLIGLGSIAALLALGRWRPGFPGALLVAVVGTALVAALGLHARGVAIVGEIPRGLPGFRMPLLNVGIVRDLLPTAIAISFVGFMESISVAKSFASINRYKIDANKELVGLGLANLSGSLFQSYPVTGGFSRTAVNARAGARTGIAALITGGFVLFTLRFLTPLFHYMPKAVLAGIIMTAVFGLIDIREVKHLYKVKRVDLALLAMTFMATLTLGIELGILVGVGASIANVMIGVSRPHTAVLGRLPGTHVYRNIARHPETRETGGVLVVRIDAQFYFGNVTFLEKKLERLEARSATPIKAIVIDASSINQLDSSADRALHELVDGDLKERGVALYFAGVKGPVLDVMARSGLETKLGDDHIFFSVRRAVEAAVRHQHLDSGATQVPLPR